jgi:hypothetical protein
MGKAVITLILLYLGRRKVKNGLSIRTVHFQMLYNLIYISTVTYKNDCTLNYYYNLLYQCALSALEIPTIR